MKKLRRSNYLTQKQVADKIGISKQNYSQIERGDRAKYFHPKVFLILSDLFNVPVKELLKKEVERGE